MKRALLPILTAPELSATAFDYAKREYEFCMGKEFTREEFDTLAQGWAFLPNGAIYTPELSNFDRVAMVATSEQPIIVERYADNGALSHYELVGKDGEVLWSEEGVTKSVTLSRNQNDFATFIGAKVKLSDGSTGVNLGLYFSETRLQMRDFEPNGVNIWFPDKMAIWVQNFNQVELILPPVKMSIHVMRFIGSDGSVGYRHNEVYRLSVGSKRGGGLVAMLSDNDDTRVEYESLKSFMDNWQWEPKNSRPGRLVKMFPLRKLHQCKSECLWPVKR